MTPQKLSSVLVLAALIGPMAAAAQEPGSDRRNFTAQHKAKVAVMKFENTNAEATAQGFGASVSAMLITFLKRQSQLVVVERQNLDLLLDEWKKRETGVVQAPPDTDPLQAPVLDPTQALALPAPQQQPLFEYIDAILDGRVTVLGDCGDNRRDAQGARAPAPPPSEDRCSVEIDARLISPRDAHIIAAAHRSGKRSDLRSTVEALGVDLEQGLLRPYYGNLTLTVDQPTNVRVFLTPILRKGASDDERPAVPLDRTFTPQPTQVLVEKWVTTPNVANVASLLGGWYSVRLERPGFESVGVDNTRLQLNDTAGQTPRLEQINGAPLTPEQQSFVVQIVPFETRKWPTDGRQVQLSKKGGSVAIRVRREFLDREYREPADVAGLKTFLRAETRDPRDARRGTGVAMLEINDRSDLDAAATGAVQGAATLNAAALQIQSRLDDISRCSYEPSRPVFEEFAGGRLLIEDYHRLPAGQARRLPVGSYRISALAPNYWVRTTSVFDVADKVDDRIVQVDLKRMTGAVTVTRTEPPSPGSHMVLQGRDTKFRQQVPLDFTGRKTIVDLPVDTYDVSTDLPGFDQWKGWFVLESDANIPGKPSVEAAKAEADAGDCVVKEEKVPEATFAFDLKTQPWLGGRVERMNRFSNPNVSVRKDFTQRFDTFVSGEQKKQPDPARAANDAGSVLVARPTAAIEADDQLEYLQWYLGQIDLLYLDDADMQRLVKLPAAAKMVRDYIDRGGAVYCFISQPGDYASILGAPISFDTKRNARKEIELRQGDVKQLQLNLKLEFQQAREFPTLRVGKEGTTPWKVVAYRKKGKEPAILEKGEVGSGGYVLVWLDSLTQLPEHKITEDALATIEKRAFAWAQFLMYRRVGPNSPLRADAESKLNTPFSASGEGKVLP